jgi:NADH-quinone oxidoreductase subunit J
MVGIYSTSQPPFLLPLPLADASVLGPAAILILCVIAGVGTVLLLPSGKHTHQRKLGGAILVAAGLILVAILTHSADRLDLTGSGVYFWFLSATAIVAAFRVITHPRPVYSALYFVLTVFATAGLFVLMYAEFMAAALILIYAGAILVTYVFVIMLAATAQGGVGKAALTGLAECDAVSREPFTAACIGFTLMGVLLMLIFDKGQQLSPAPAVVIQGVPSPSDSELIHGTTQALGAYLFNEQVVNLELAGLILTVAMVGAIVIARRRVVGVVGAYEPESEMITANMTPLSDDPKSIPVYGTDNPKQKAFPET